MKYIVNEHLEFKGNNLEKGTIVHTEGNNIRLLYKQKLYDVKVLSMNEEEKTCIMKVNGYRRKVRRSEKIDDLIARLGFNVPPKHELKEVLAPMPGLVKEVYVKAGDTVTTGDNLFVLEAMKMENIIKAAGDGVVSAVLVKKGDKVEKSGRLAKL
ncbi:MAG: acetyl-CoA carboxylase biotin carboxyl carrier protein subunit [Saprospiraceae bacterium]|nr:acetyl-CoA carboxylase biotin carboxyl carrier protein subunit [Saprospiraceae bacterium]